MPESDTIKVLIVDDLPEKLLVYRSILEDPGVEVVSARSGAEALGRLLHEEFAVVLLDVNMPGMDGFETAALIRGRKRCAHIPIIFVTAHSDEMHQVRGYAYGAVDYILTPVVPDVLRTKVGVFVELFRKTQQVRRQAEVLRELEAREHRRQLREFNERLELAMQAGNMVACEWDGGSRLLSWSPGFGEVFGFPPGEFSGAAEDLRNRLLPEDRDWVMRSLQDAFGAGGEFRLEHRIIRPDGTQAWLELRGRVFPGEEDAAPRLLGVCMDITQRKRADETRAHLAAIVDSTDDAVIGKTLDGIITSFNPAAERLFGYTAEEVIGRPICILVPPERIEEEEDILLRLRRGERKHFESVRMSKDGRRIDMTLTVSPVLEPNGRISGGSTIARDIGERKRIELEIRRHREHLEQLVRERTSELEASHQRLRLADRLASVGTLAAGLGHDLGNLLLPVRMRLDALEQIDLPPEAREDLEAIARACDYLSRLSQGLRLFALNPEDSHGSGAFTDIHAWWEEVSKFLENILPRTVSLECEFAPELPPLAIAPHVLAQIVYNLIQNAGEALRDRRDGRIIIRARQSSEAGRVTLCVCDNGPGMDEETRRRCLDPFFTTKTRALSTGLGLALVCGALRTVGGGIEVESSPGNGSTFWLSIPTTSREADDPSARRGETACVDLADVRTRAFVTMVLQSVGVDVLEGGWSERSTSRLAVLDRVGGREEELAAYLGADCGRTVVAIGDDQLTAGSDRIIRVPSTSSAAQTRDALALAARTSRRTMAESLR
jgi:PAS domain S-box-containing protein